MMTNEQEKYWRIEQRVQDLSKMGLSKHTIFDIVANQIVRHEFD